MLIEWIPTHKYFSNYITISPYHLILDFGSNWGNLLNSSQGSINQKNYTGIDVDIEAIEEGRKLFPLAKWMHYNRHNPVYNSNGIKCLPNLYEKYDWIISYSVFTHMNIDDTVELIDHLMDFLSPSGGLVFSWCNIDYSPCVDWFRARRTNCDEIFKGDYAYLIDNKVSLDGNINQSKHFVSFYSQRFLANKLEKYNLQLFDPISPWVQHCAMLTK